MIDTKSMFALLTNTQGNTKRIECPRPNINSSEALIKTLGCGVCGTDLLKINLKLLNTDTILGHEVAGEIVEVGRDVTHYSVGDIVVAAHHVPCFECHYCRHGNESMCAQFKNTNLKPGGFAEYFTLSQEHLQHTTFKVPKDMPWQEAIFTEPLACCVRNIDRLNLQKQDTVAVIGLGSIGLMMIKLVKRLGVSVIGLDVDANRCALAKIAGADFTSSERMDSEGVTKKIKELTDARGLDGIIFTAGPATLLEMGLKQIRNGGFLNLFSHLSGETTPINTADLYHREIQLITTYSSSPASLTKSFAILRDENLELRKMFASYSPDQFDSAIKDVMERKIFKALIAF